MKFLMSHKPFEFMSFQPHDSDHPQILLPTFVDVVFSSEPALVCPKPALILPKQDAFGSTTSFGRRRKSSV